MTSNNTLNITYAFFILGQFRSPCRACGILVPQPRIKPRPSARHVVTTEPPGIPATHIFICPFIPGQLSSLHFLAFMDNRAMNICVCFCVHIMVLGSKITTDGDCSHEIKRCLLLGRKAMTNLDSILKSRDITLSTKVRLVKAMVFPVVMYGCESWTIKKAESRRIDAFELWCWRKVLRVSWTAKRSNQSILKEISPEYSLEGLMLKPQ